MLHTKTTKMKIRIFKNENNQWMGFEAPEKPDKLDWRGDYQRLSQMLDEHRLNVSLAKHKALPILNPEIIKDEHIVPYPTDNFVHDWLGEAEIKWTDGWMPSYNNPDNSGCDQPAEPEGYFLSLPDSGHSFTEAMETAKLSPERVEEGRRGDTAFDLIVRELWNQSKDGKQTLPVLTVESLMKEWSEKENAALRASLKELLPLVALSPGKKAEQMLIYERAKKLIDPR